jgi:hypothetical protein
MENLRWKKSSRSGSNSQNCVEVARTGSQKIAARDSKNPKGPILPLERSQWRGFITQVKSGRYDL